VRILITNDDGVNAPGISALARAARTTGHDLVIVAPLGDHSGAGAAVGPVHQREGVAYESFTLSGIEDVPTFGVDGPPALATILACLGSFGPTPDLVLSGINHGANLGRSALHSGTIGATLTGAQFALRGLAVSIRWGEEPIPWDSPAAIAMALLPHLLSTPPGTVWNLNVPDVPLEAVRGVRHGRLGRTGTIRSALRQDGSDIPPGDRPELALPPLGAGVLQLGLSMPGVNAPAGAPVLDDEDLVTDAELVSANFASLTALVGVREGPEEEHRTLSEAVARLAPLHTLGFHAG
jgi:5'-nucleotidase